MSRAIARSYYQRFLALAEKWPVNPDLGHENDPAVLLRRRIRDAFLEKNSPPINVESCERQYKALKDIIESKHKSDFQSNRYYGALGLSYEELEFANSEEARKYLEERDELKEKIMRIMGREQPKSLMPPSVMLPEEQKKLEEDKENSKLIESEKSNKP